MSALWKNWLTVWCWGVVVFGAVLVLAAVPGANGVSRLVITTLGGSDTLLDDPAFQFAFGLQGALSIGWAITTFGMFRAAETGGAPVWRSLTFGFLTWYVIDSVISMRTGFPLNAVSNTVVMAGYLVPVLASGVLRGGVRTATA